jgi:hypothetical protein
LVLFCHHEITSLRLSLEGVTIERERGDVAGNMEGDIMMRKGAKNKAQAF